MKKIGRPPSTTDKRETRITLYVTEEDAAYLADLAARMGFKGRSEMIVAILERLIIGGFAVLVFLKVGLQFRKRADETGSLEEKFYFGIRPLPALPVEDSPSRDELREVLGELKREIETKPVC